MSFGVDYQKFGLENKDLSFITPKFILVEKRNWDYDKAHEFQKECVEFIRHNRDYKIFIICNHPHCFTLGRGLQKNKDLQGIELIDFAPNMKERLEIPLFDIKRGGGLTFHYPGQLICYPIVSLGKKLDVYKTMNFVLDIAKTIVEKEYGLENLSYKEKLLGLWWGKLKMASIGIAVSRFITYHGMAFNVVKDEVMKKELQKVFPCGLPGDVYVSLEEASKQNNIYDFFWEKYRELLVERVMSELSAGELRLGPS